MEHQPSEKFNRGAVPVGPAEALADAEAVMERSQLEATRDQLLGRMQEIFEQEGPLTDSDRAALDYLEVELASLGRELGEDILQTETTEEALPDDEVVTIGGKKNIDAEVFMHNRPAAM